MNILAILVSALCFISTPPPDGVPIPSSQELEQRIREYRKSIVTGHVVIESRTPRTKARGYEAITRTYHVTFEQGKIRCMVDWVHPRWARMTRSVRTEHSFIRDWSEDYPILVGGPEGPPRASGMEVFDPRLLGLAPTMLTRSSQFDLDHFWFSGTGESPIVTEEVLEGERTWRIEYRPSTSDRVLLWVAPRLGYTTPRVEVRTKSGNAFIPRQILKASYTQYPPGNVWYAMNVTYQSLTSKGVVDEEENLQVREATFGTKVDSAAFRFEGLGIVAGRKVRGPGNRAMIWNGHRLVDE